nr:cyclic nucleotide-binding domain-containing protein [Priestia aryabhattai]
MNITSDSFSNELQQFFMDFAHKVSFKKGDFLFQEGSTSTHLFFITSGAVQVGKFRRLSWGSHAVLRIYPPHASSKSY